MRKVTSLTTRVALCFAAVASMIGSASASQWVRISDNGTVTGRVVVSSQDDGLVAVNSGRVALVGQDGKSLHAETDAAGKFSISGVAPGVYSMAAIGEQSVACCAIHAVSARTPGADKLQANFDVVSANVPRVALKAALLRYLPPRLNTENTSIETAELSKLASNVAFTAPYRVSQTAGGMNGQINAAGANAASIGGSAGAQVMIFQDGTQVASQVADAAGKFRINNLAAGSYSLLTVGSHGLAAVGFELVDAASLKQASASSAKYTLVQDITLAPGQTFTIQVAPSPEAINQSEELPADGQIISDELIGETIIDDGFGTPMGGGGGGFSGGGGGFSGGGGGAGGGGGILGLAAAGGIIAAVAASDDDDAAVAPASPANP